jgi:hypothetical protein
VSPRLAVELTPTHLRAVIAPSWRDAVHRTHDVPWSPDDPAAGVAALRSAAGGVESVSVAVGLGLLQVARVSLPPADHEARERMLALEGERFFPQTGTPTSSMAMIDSMATIDSIDSIATIAAVLPTTTNALGAAQPAGPAGGRALVSCIAPGGAVAFAVEESALERWSRALETIAPVVRVEATPVALARALGRGAARVTQGTFAISLDGEGHGVVSVKDGCVTSARRIPAQVDERPGVPLPDSPGLPARHVAAWGALLGEDEPALGTLASPSRRAAFSARRRRRLAVAAVAAAAGMVLAVTAADQWRERTVRALQDDVASRRAAAAPGEAALAARAQLDAEFALLARAAASRHGTLGALAAISAALPRDAVILNAHAVDGEWQLDGTAANAAALVPLLDRDGRFEQVRILSASSRFRDGRRTRETFSLALRVRPRS